MLNRFLAVLVVASVSTLGCGVESDFSETGTTPRASFTGQSLYEGLYFGEGPARVAFPEIWESETVNAHMMQVDREHLAEQRRQLITELKNRDPSFFDRFGVEIQSGDHLRIEAMLAEAQKLTLDAAQSIVPARGPGLPSPYRYQVVAVDVAVAAVVAVAAFVVVVVAVVKEDSANGTLGSDLFVDTLANRDFSDIRFRGTTMPPEATNH